MLNREADAGYPLPSGPGSGPDECPAFSMGVPDVDLDQAVRLAATIEDAEVMRKLANPLR